MRYIRRVSRPRDAGKPTDGELLDRFVTHKDEAAFEALVRRHGRMVLGVCQRVLNDVHDAEDASQATFLVLIRSARSIAKRDSVGSWLYGVAYRAALKARAAAFRRRSKEKQGGIMVETEPNTDLIWRDLRPVLDEELSRLPEKYREPLVLCYLEGKTNEEAAQRLQWTKGTVSGRLARARDLLRQRLTRRGLALSSGVLVTALSEQAASAALTSPLIESTLKAALLITWGKSAAGGAISVKVAALTEGVMKAMFLTKLKILAAVALAVTVAGAGAGLLRYYAPAGEQEQSQPAAQKKADSPAPKKPAPAAKDEQKILGTWKVVACEKAGKPVAGQELDAWKMVRIVFSADTYFLKTADGEIVEWRYSLDPGQNPKVIHLSRKGQGSVKWIYAIKDDSLKLCSSNKMGEEATELKTKEGTDLMLLDLARAAADDKPAQADVEKRREMHKRLANSNNLKWLSQAMQVYHGKYNHFPPSAISSKDGKPLLSWRVAILPYIDQDADALYKEFHLDELWDSEHNKKLLAKMPRVYAPVPVYGPVKGVKTREPHMTFYRVFTGKGTVFEHPQGNTLLDVTDGPSNTILIVEAGEPVPWTKPEELPYDPDKALPKLGSGIINGFNVILCDGSVHVIRKDFDEKVMRLLITRNDGQPVNIEDIEDVIKP
jgi:RNA polymerase sigma-70 factor (ECF subfamily)